MGEHFYTRFLLFLSFFFVSSLYAPSGDVQAVIDLKFERFFPETELYTEQTDAQKHRENMQTNFTADRLEQRLRELRACEKALASATDPKIVDLRTRLTQQIAMTNMSYEGMQIANELAKQGFQLKW